MKEWLGSSNSGRTEIIFNSLELVLWWNRVLVVGFSKKKEQF
jgi:hypothetical protein